MTQTVRYRTGVKLVIPRRRIKIIVTLLLLKNILSDLSKQSWKDLGWGFISKEEES